MVTNDEPVQRLFTQGMVIKDGAKMSKSKGNVVSPDDMVARYGADATRMYACLPRRRIAISTGRKHGVEGVQRFLGRVYRFVVRNARGIEWVSDWRWHRCFFQRTALLKLAGSAQASPDH